MVSVLFITKVLFFIHVFSFATPKQQHRHLMVEQRKRDSVTKRQYLYSPYRQLQDHYWRADRRHPYARALDYYKANAHRRQLLPGMYSHGNLRTDKRYPSARLPGVHPLGKFLLNPSQYGYKLNSNMPKYRLYSTSQDPHYDGTKTKPMNIRKTFRTGVPLQIRPAGSSKIGSALDEPAASEEESSSGNMKQGSFKIDDGPVKGFGTYQIKGDQVEVDINIRITPEGDEAKPTSAPSGTGENTTPGSKPTSPSGGGNVTTAPSGETTTPSPSSGGEDASAFEQEALKAHNDYRARHEAPAMTLNKEMSNEAAEWAKELGANKKFEHSPSDKRKNQGENIAAWCDAKGETATQVTKRWYDEVCEAGYDFSRNDMDWAAGHFTQVVWKKSTELGIGFYDKKRDDGWVCRTVVARYREPGNGGGTFLENVKKGSFDKDKDCTKEAKKRYRVLY